MLTIDQGRTSDAGRAGEPGEPGADVSGRERLLAEVLDELTAAKSWQWRAEAHKWIRERVSLSHLQVLGLLEAESPRSIGSIARALDVSLASATGIVDRMEERGLVNRERDPHDRRVVLVAIADGGRAVREELQAQTRSALHRVLVELDDIDLGHLLVGIRALRSARRRMTEAGASGGEATATQGEGQAACP